MIWDIIRLLNLLLALYCLAGMVPAYAWWGAQPRHTRFLLLALGGLTLATGYGTAEAMWQGVPGGARVLAFTPALAWAAYGITSINSRKDPS